MLEQQHKKKYKCDQCNPKMEFSNIREYIMHLDQHKQLISKLPVGRIGKKPIVDKVFSLFKSKKNNKMEVFNMGNEVAQPALGVVNSNDRVAMLEKSIAELSRVVVNSEAAKANDVARVEQGVVGSVNKTLKISILVDEKFSGELLKLIQETKDYYLEGVELKRS